MIDLRNLLQSSNKDAFYRDINLLLKAGVLSRFSQGFYITKEFDIRILSQRICPESYISFGTILAQYLLIGSVPTYRIRAVKIGSTREYSNDEFRIEHLKLKPELFFGYEFVEGIKTATPEKAVLDTLYFYKLGTKFSFDVYSDIDYSYLNKAKLIEFLSVYKNQSFKEFVRNIIDV